MKKKIILILLILMASFMAFVKIFQSNIILVKAEDVSTDFASYEREVEAINKSTTYEVIYISKSNLKLEEAISVFDNNGEIVINYDYTWLVDEINNICFENLNKNKLDEICKKYDFLVSDSKECYKIYSKFCLKHLIVKGDLNGNYYGANQIATGYKNYNLLAYKTEEQTKLAYEILINQPNLTVQIDELFIAEDYETEELSSTSFSSGTYNSWGANAIEIDKYKEYLGNIPTDRQVVVAVIDTGINTNHQMFQDRFLYDSYGNILGKSYYTSQYTYSGYSFEDDQGHGTHVAGIICDLTPSNVKILPIKALKYDKNGSYNNILLAIQCVYEEFLGKGLNIVCINMSFGGNAGNDTELINSFIPLFNECRENKILPIVASGNESSNTSTRFPAGCDNAVVVSALKQSGNSYVADTSYTNYGKSVDISAPGTEILSCAKESDNSTALSILNGGSYSTKLCYMSGTSMATPHVSAVVCLLYLDDIYYNQSGESCYTAELIETRLMKMAERKMSKDGKIDASKSNWAYYYGVGMLSMKYFQYKDIQYEVQPTTYTYDGKYHNISITLTQTYTNAQIFYGLGANTCNITDITTNDSFKNATGNSGIDIYFKITADGYEETLGKSKLIINKRTAIIEVQNQTGIYGNNPKLSNSGIKFKSGVIAGDTVSVQLTTVATRTKPIGQYKIYASTTNQNYKLEINYTSTSGYYVITPRPIIIEMQNDEGVYGETIIFSNRFYISTTSPYEIVEGDDLGVKSKCSVTSSTSVGEYDLDATCSNENYRVTVIKGVFTVTPKPVTISLQNQYGVYGEIQNLNQTKYTLNTDVDASNLGTITISTNATDKSPVGNYALSVKFTNNNYTASINSTSYYVISARTLNISAENQSGIYGETPSLNNAKYTINSGLIGDDSVIVSLNTTATKKSVVGTYPISATTTNLNYIIKVDEGEYKVIPRSLTVQLDNFTDEYGNDRILPCLYNITVGSLAEGDDKSDLKITTSNNASKTSPVGDYIISGSYSNPNYNITINNAKLTIQPRTINIELQNQYGVYGESVNLDQTKYSATNIIAGDNVGVHLSVDASNKSSVGNYLIKAIVTNANYKTNIITNGYYVVGKRAITIKINNQYGVYGESATLSNVKYVIESGTVVNEDKLDISVFTDTTSSSKVGEYDMRAVVLNDNYDITVNSGKYIIQARKITISLQNQAGEYGYTPTLQTNKFDIIVGSIVNDDNLNLTLSTTATAKSSVGLYSLSLTKYNENYIITSNIAQYEILPRIISLQPKNVTGIYGNQPTLNGYISSKQIISGDDLNIQLSTTATSKSTVGNYNILITASHPNYTISCEKGIYTISPRQIQISAQNQNGIYGETPVLDNSKYSITSGTIVNGDEVNITLSTDAISTSQVGGNYPLTASTDNENYTIITISGRYIINQREIEIELENQNGQYGNTPTLDNSKYSIKSGTVIGADDLNITLSTTATYKSNANTKYDIKASCGNGNYRINYEYGKYLILPRPITIKLTQQSGFYGNSHILNNLQFTVENGSVVNNDNLNLQLSTTATNLSEVGSYSITVQSWGNRNYSVSSISGVFKVLARKITISVHQQFVIGEDVKLDLNNYTIISGSVVSGDDLLLSMTTNANSSSIKGSYNIDVVCGNKNYEITTQEAVCEIIAKSVVIKKVASSYYGEDISINADFEIVSGKIIKGDDLGIFFSTNATSKSPAGDYNITETHTNTNYEVVLQDCIYKVLPRIITVNVDNQQGEYGSTPKLNTNYTIIDGIIINDDKVSIALSTLASSRSPIGEYDIIAKSSNKNYQINVNLGKYTVIPRSITVKLTNQSGIYGNEVNLNNSKYVVTSGSVFVSDNLNIKLTTSATAKSEVGEYDITLSYDNKNYLITTIKAKYIISPKNIAITVNLSGVYGEDIEISKNQTIVKSEDLINGDNLNLYVTTTATNLSPVGKYDLQVISNNTNYTVTLQNSKFEITPRPIEIQLDNQSGIYGNKTELSNTAYYVLTGNVIGDDDLMLQLKTLATSISSVGEYELFATYSNNNYTITINNGLYIITPRAITIKISNNTSIYGEDISITYSTYSVIEGKLIGDDKLNLQYKTTATNLSPVGKYDITAHCLNNNYTATIQVGELEITKRQVSLNVVASSQYGNDINLTDYTYEEVSGKIVNNDDLMFVLQTSAQKTDTVGEYELEISGGNSNYLFTILKATYKIMPRQLNIMILPQSSVYGDEIILNQESYLITSGNILEGDSVGITLSTLAEQFKSAGEYDIIADCFNKNYALNIESAKYCVLPRDISVSIIYTVEYGYNLQFDNMKFSLISGRIINDDKLNIKVSYSTQNSLEIGDFYVNIVSANSNYNITLLDSVLHIIPRKIGIKINQSSIYGDDVVLNQNDYTLTKDLYGSDSLNLQLTTSATNISPVGEYDIEIINNNTNYQMEILENVLTITPREIMLNITNASSVYGEEIDLNSISFSVIKGSVVNNDDLQIEFITNATSKNDAGTYIIDAKSNNNNYNLTNSTGTYTINKRKLTIKLDNQSTYRGVMFKIKQGEYEIVQGNVVEGDDLKIKQKSKAKMFYFAGDYSLYGVCGNDNYEVEFIPAELKVKISFFDYIFAVALTVGAIGLIVAIIKAKKRKKKAKQQLAQWDDIINW